MADDVEKNDTKNTGDDLIAKIAELEQKLARKDTEMAETCAKVTTLAGTLQERESELAATRKTLDEAQSKISVMGGELGEAVKNYRTLLTQSNPGITEDLISGETIGAIDESMVKARKLVSMVRQSVEKEMARGRVPIGSPGRQVQDMTALSPREKINYGIGGKK